MTQRKTYNLFSSISLKEWKRQLLSAVMVLLCAMSHAQGWEISFGGNFDDWGHSIVQARNNDYLLAGYSQSFAGATGVYAVRTDVDGRKIWEKGYDEGHVSYGYSIIQTDDDAFLIVGQIVNVPQDFQFNAYLLKINNQGDLLWSQQYGGSENDAGWRVIPCEADGGYLIVGRTASSGNGGDDVYLVKVDENGNQIWSNAYGSAQGDIGRSAVENNLGYLVTGVAYNDTNNSKDVYLLQVDFDGNKIWEKWIGTNNFDEGQDIVATLDGNYAIVGNSEQEAYLVKVTPTGDIIWTNTYGGTQSTIAICIRM